jgi:hypothetical protein
MGNVRRSERAAVSVGSCAHDQVTGVLVEAWRRRIDHFDSPDRRFNTFSICCVLDHEVLGSLLSAALDAFSGVNLNVVKVILNDAQRRWLV